MSRSGWRWENVPLPEMHLGALGAAIAAHQVIPLRVPLSPTTARLIGLPIATAGIGLAAWAVRSASVAGVAIDRPGNLVTAGAFSVARNPMYQGWTLAVAGLGVASRSAWMLAGSVIAAGLAHREVLAEEAALSEEFGTAYADYAAATPRYLLVRLSRMNGGERGS